MDNKPKVNILSYNIGGIFSHYIVNIFRDAERRHISSFCTGDLKEAGEFIRKEGKGLPLTSDLDVDYERKAYPAARLVGPDEMNVGSGISFSKLDRNEITLLAIGDIAEQMNSQDTAVPKPEQI
jgi:hypothetical protein